MLDYDFSKKNFLVFVISAKHASCETVDSTLVVTNNLAKCGSCVAGYVMDDDSVGICLSK